jgi:Flp pilus assembly protein protease CpaA
MSIDPQAWGALLVTGAAAAFDIRRRRIPNGLTLASAVAGLLCAWLAARGRLPGWPGGVGDALLATSLTLLAGLLAWSRGLLGGGDAKLLAAVAAWVGFPAIIEVTLWTVTSALVLFMVLCAARGRMLACLRTVVAVPVSVVFGGLRRHVDEELLALRLPLGVAVFLGVCSWFVTWRLQGGLA